MGDEAPNAPAAEESKAPSAPAEENKAPASSVDAGTGEKSKDSVGQTAENEKNGLIGDLMKDLLDGNLNNKSAILKKFAIMAAGYFCNSMNIPKDIADEILVGISNMFDKKIPSGIEELIGNSDNVNPKIIKEKVFLASEVASDSTKYTQALNAFKANANPTNFVSNFYPTLVECFKTNEDGSIVPKNGATMPNNFVLPKKDISFKDLLKEIAKNANYFNANGGAAVKPPSFFDTLAEASAPVAPATPEAPAPATPAPEASAPVAPATPEAPAPATPAPTSASAPSTSAPASAAPETSASAPATSAPATSAPATSAPAPSAQ